MLAIPCACAQSLEKLARAYREHPTTRNRAVLDQYAARHKDASGALALLALASEDVLQKRSAEAVARLRSAEPRLKPIADYAAFLTASAQFDLGDDRAVLSSIETVFAATPKSPLNGRAALLAANAWVRSGEPRKPIEALRRHYDDLPQPDGDLALARSFEAAGDSISAAAYYQRVYYGKPLSSQAGEAEAALTRLRASLGASYPAVMPQTLLSRARALLNGGAYSQAERELTAILPSLAGSDREAALLNLGEARYRLNDNSGALEYFESLKLSRGEADAQRLYYIAAAARRLNNLDAVRRTLAELAERYPRSQWRLEALVSAGNHYLLNNDVAAYRPLYEDCYTAFPDSDWAPYCHWKVAFAEYLARRDDARAKLEFHIRNFPNSDQAPAALYFLGRLAESNSNWETARTYYDEITTNYPNYYYAVLARKRLQTPALARARADMSVVKLLETVSFPLRARRIDFKPSAVARRRIARARLLAAAALDQYAEMELRFGATEEDQPHVMGLELARLASRRGNPDQAIRYIKRYAPGYLFLPLDSAPDEFWRLAFPLPYRQAITTHSRRNGLDPYLVAALIRQESEFNARAVSRARAYGLTQVLPSTGRMLSRKLGIRRFSPSLLFHPDANIRLGTYYIKTLVADLDGNVCAALAAYNAGKSRAAAWLSWSDYREPAEFVEAVPFSETRNYIQMVLRNADVYRRIYGRSLGSSRRPPKSR
jgi:soluble lytic murein transglycosylase